MKAININMIIEDNITGEYFITQVLPKLKKQYHLKQVNYNKCRYFEV